MIVANYPDHDCATMRPDAAADAAADGRTLTPDVATCGTCDRSWCARCAPTPASLCPWCNGAGGSEAPIPPRQRLELVPPASAVVAVYRAALEAEPGSPVARELVRTANRLSSQRDGLPAVRLLDDGVIAVGWTPGGQEITLTRYGNADVRSGSKVLSSSDAGPAARHELIGAAAVYTALAVGS